MAPPKTAPNAKPAATKPSRSASLSTREALRQQGPSRRQISRHEREERRRKQIYITAGALVAVIALVLGFGLIRENFLRGRETVAVIFGETITADMLSDYARPQIQAFDKNIALYRTTGLSQQASQLSFQRPSLPQTSLNQLIQERVVKREAERRGITVTPDEVDAKLRQLIADSDAANQPQPTPTPGAPAAATPSATAAGTATPFPTATTVPTLTEDRYGTALQDFMNRSGYQEPYIRQALTAQLYQEKLSKAIGEEVPSVQDQIHARHIVFKSKDDADAGVAQLSQGVDFATLASTQSQDSTTKEKGGDLGWLVKSGNDPSFDQALFALQPGQQSDVVQTTAGWEIIQALERNPARPVDDDQLAMLRQRQYNNWLSVAIGSPEIERKLSPEMSDWVLTHVAGRRAP